MIRNNPQTTINNQFVVSSSVLFGLHLCIQVLQLDFVSTARQLTLGHSWVIQQDNDPKNILKLVFKWLKQTNIQLLEFTSPKPRALILLKIE